MNPLGIQHIIFIYTIPAIPILIKNRELSWLQMSFHWYRLLWFCMYGLCWKIPRRIKYAPVYKNALFPVFSHNFWLFFSSFILFFIYFNYENFYAPRSQRKACINKGIAWKWFLFFFFVYIVVGLFNNFFAIFPQQSMLFCRLK